MARFFDRPQQHVQVGQQLVGSLHHLHGKAGIQYVGRGHALVDKTRLRADIFGNRGKEGNHVMLDLCLYGIDPGDVEVSLFTDNRYNFLGDHTQFSLGLTGQSFNFQPDAETVFRFPDVCHFRSGITRDHFISS